MLSRTLFLAVAAASSATVVLAAPAQAQQYPPSANFITVSDPTPSPGQTVTMRAGTFASGSTVSFTLSSDPVDLGSATASGDLDDDGDDGDDGDGGGGGGGVVSIDAMIPEDIDLGTHTVTASGSAPNGTPLSLSTTIRVVAPGGGQGAGSGRPVVPGAGAEAVPTGVGAPVVPSAGAEAVPTGIGGPVVPSAGAEAAPTGVGVGGERSLPRTGGDALPLVRIGGALLAVGGGLLFVTRRHRASAGS